MWSCLSWGRWNSESDFPNIAAPHLRSQKGLRVRDRDEGESSKRQRRGMVGKGKSKGSSSLDEIQRVSDS